MRLRERAGVHQRQQMTAIPGGELDVVAVGVGHETGALTPGGVSSTIRATGRKPSRDAIASDGM